MMKREIVPNLKGGAAEARTRRKRAFVALSLMFAVLACSEAWARSPLEHAERSEAALAEAVLEALSRRDTVALQGFLVSRGEYEGLLWPEMPDKEYTPFDFVWSLNQANTRKGLGQLLNVYGGLKLEVVSVRFTEAPETYGSFRLHQGVEVTVRQKETGDVGILGSFDVLVEYGGAWKLLNYDEI